MYQFRCPYCRARLGQKTETSVGREKSCPKCAARFQVPPPGKKAVLVAPGQGERAAESASSSAGSKPTGPAGTRPAGRPSRPVGSKAAKSARSAKASSGAPPRRTRKPSPPAAAQSSGVAPPAPDRSEESSLFELADDFSDLDGLDELSGAGGSGAPPTAPAALPPKKKQKKAEPLRPRKHVEDYHVAETAEDRMAKVGTTVLHAENVLARRITMIVVGSVLLFLGARVLRGRLLYFTFEGQMQMMEQELLAEEMGEMTDADWAEFREQLEIDYGEDWTDGHFDELKEMMLAGKLPDDDYFPDPIDHSIDPDADVDARGDPIDDLFDAEF